MTLKKNIIANYVGTGVVVAAPILALPWYVAALGPERWGLISFVATLQAVLGLLDAGVSQALVREFSIRLSADDGGRRRAAVLLLGFERIYWLFSIIAAFMVALFADVLARSWLKLGWLPLDSGRMAVYGAAAIFAVQFPGSVYRSVLVGAQAQISLNVILVGGALSRHVGGVIVVLTWPTLSAYLVWHVLVILVETVVRFSKAWDTLCIKRNTVGWDGGEIRRTLVVVVGMSAATLLGALAVQMDKIILSRMLPIEQFGYYSIASTIAVGALQLIYPITSAALPRIIQLHNEPLDLRRFTFKLAILFASLSGIVGLFFYLFGRLLLEFWLHNSMIVSVIYVPLAILLIGTAMNAIWNVGYLVWLANGKAGLAVISNAVSLCLCVLLTPIMVARYGLNGSAFGWLFMNIAGMMLSLGWLKSKSAN